MHQRRVVAVHLFQCDNCLHIKHTVRAAIVCLLLSFPFSLTSFLVFPLSVDARELAKQGAFTAVNEKEKYLARIEVNTPMELEAVLKRSSDYFNTGGKLPKVPIHLVLHGAEAEVFLWDNYPKYRQTVNLAAQLEALQIVEIEICETWMEYTGVKGKELAPFVNTVPYGPGREESLLKKGFVYF